MKLKKIAILTMIIGTIGVALNLLFGNSTITFISSATKNGITYYKYDFWAYIENIKIGLSNPSELKLEWQQLTWVNITSNILQEEFWQDLGNNMAYILNTIVYGLNVLLYPFRIASYIGRTALSILGVNLQNAGGLQWLIQTINTLISFQIPYVQV